MSQQYIKIVNEIYKEMKNNIDIIKYWFESDHKELDEERLFKYIKCDFTPILETENDIYIFINKMINNILYAKSFQTRNLNYLEENFISLANIVIDNYKKTSLKG